MVLIKKWVCADHEEMDTVHWFYDNGLLTCDYRDGFKNLVRERALESLEYEMYRWPCRVTQNS